MKIKMPALIALACITATAQHTISGTFSPKSQYPWLLIYQLQPGGSEYLAEGRISEGRFSLPLKEGIPAGMLRIVYGVPQDTYYFDVIYNRKEDIDLSFIAEEGLFFNKSEENQFLTSYFRDILAAEQQLIAYYKKGRSDTAAFNQIRDKLKETQKTWEGRSQGMLAQSFIIANTPYVPASYESPEKYMEHKKAHYFDHLDFKDPLLQASDFLSEKVLNYVLTAGTLDKTAKTVAMNDNSHLAAIKMEAAPKAIRLKIYERLWSRLQEQGYPDTADFIFERYLKDLADNTGHSELVEKIEGYNRLRIGAIAPEITWKSNGEQKSLSALYGADCYVLVFWSSGCSHCLNELPKLQDGLKGTTGIKVLAVGLEDDEENWQKESRKVALFEHVLALGKWDNPYVKLYAVSTTPTYFILDQAKQILAKPEDYKELLKWLKANGYFQ